MGKPEELVVRRLVLSLTVANDAQLGRNSATQEASSRLLRAYPAEHGRSGNLGCAFASISELPRVRHMGGDRFRSDRTHLQCEMSQLWPRVFLKEV